MARGRAAKPATKAAGETEHWASVAAGDYCLAMDPGPFKDVDMDTRSEPAVTSEELTLCQHAGSARLISSQTRLAIE
jgi:hypothetical protein